MNNYILSCCSTADLAKEHFEKRDLNYICFHYELDGKQYADDLGESVSFEDFYKVLHKFHHHELLELSHLLKRCL